MTLSTVQQGTEHPLLGQRHLGSGRGPRWREKAVSMKIRQAVVLLSATVVFVTLPLLAWSQSGLSSGDSSGETGNATVGRLDLTYVRPSPRTTLNHYVFDAFGPYPFLSTAFFRVLIRNSVRHQSGDKALLVTQNDTGQILGFLWLGHQRAMGSPRFSRKTHPITDATATESLPGCVMR